MINYKIVVQLIMNLKIVTSICFEPYRLVFFFFWFAFQILVQLFQIFRAF